MKKIKTKLDKDYLFVLLIHSENENAFDIVLNDGKQLFKYTSTRVATVTKYNLTKHSANSLFSNDNEYLLLIEQAIPNLMNNEVFFKNTEFYGIDDDKLILLEYLKKDFNEILI